VDAIPLYDDYSDRDLELLVRFHQMGREWLEERLARVDELTAKPKSARRRRAPGTARGRQSR
jgi:hypothetical protein